MVFNVAEENIVHSVTQETHGNDVCIFRAKFGTTIILKGYVSEVHIYLGVLYLA